MNFSKIAKTILTALCLVGFFMMLGAVGNQDLAVEMHVYRSLSEDMPLMIAGFCVMCVSGLILKKMEGEENYE